MAWIPKGPFRLGPGFSMLLSLLLFLTSPAALAVQNVSINASSIKILQEYASSQGIKKKSKTIITRTQRDTLTRLISKAPDRRAVRAVFNPDNGTPAFLRVKPFLKQPGKFRQQASFQAEENARYFLRQHFELLKLDQPDRELALTASRTDNLGARHLKYRQMVDGIPVFGRHLLVHTDSSDSVYLLNGHLEPTPRNLRTTPAVTEADALQTVQEHLGMADLSVDNTELVFFTRPDGEMVLTYKVEAAPTLREAWTYFINAADASFVHRLSKIRNELLPAAGIGLDSETYKFNMWHQDGFFYLIDPGMPGPLDEAQSDYVSAIQPSGNTYVLSAEHREDEVYHITNEFPLKEWDQWDPAGVSAMANLRTIHDYMETTFNRNGIDDHGMTYAVVVNVGFDPPNAEWNGKAILLGDGDNRQLSNLAEGLDVLAHELWHAVTQFTADLVYENQSGALNEAYSDLFACMVDAENWTVGEDVTLIPPYYLRNLADPTKGVQELPTQMSEYVHLPNTEDGDYGGVHINMSIPSHAGYLMAEGLDDAIGRDDTARIWYRALTTYLDLYSQFSDARMCTIQAAEDIFGSDSAQAAVVQRAWDMVGVFEDTPSSEGFGPAEIAFSTQHLDFTDIPVGTQVSRELILTNLSHRDIQISDIFLSGGDAFSHTGETRMRLPIDGEAVITVTYAPPAAGSYAADLIITSNADTPQSHISITATAVAAVQEDSSDDEPVKKSSSSGDSGGCVIHALGNEKEGKNFDFIPILPLAIYFSLAWLIIKITVELKAHPLKK